MCKFWYRGFRWGKSHHTCIWLKQNQLYSWIGEGEEKEKKIKPIVIFFQPFHSKNICEFEMWFSSVGLRFVFFFPKLLLLYWSIDDWQCYNSFRWTAKGLSHIYTNIHFSPKLPSHPGCHITLSRVPCAVQRANGWTFLMQKKITKILGRSI